MCLDVVAQFESIMSSSDLVIISIKMFPVRDPCSSDTALSVCARVFVCVL